eukprot:gb/GEZN01006331.1/.p1 GENE.gb/GEZN01006331.1/~~gb/GEZN01006331.1/.p1  ORF type:complete len:423 (-),score=58.93 gb/GEZN01006331.1/:165-1433(-)
MTLAFRRSVSFWNASKLEAGIRRPLAKVLLSQLLQSAGLGILMPVLPIFANMLGLGGSGIGLLLSSSALARFLTNAPFGRLSDSIGRKPLMVGGPLVLGLGVVGTAGVAPHLALMAPFRAAVGMGRAAMRAGLSPYIVDLTSPCPQYRGAVLGLQSAVSSLAFTAGPALGGALVQGIGCVNCFYVVGALNVACVLPLLTLPELPKSPHATTSGQPLGIVSPLRLKEETRGLMEAHGELLRRPDQRRLLAVNISYFAGYSAILTLMPMHAATVWTATPAQLGPLYSLAFGLGILGSPVAGLVSDRFGHRTVVLGAQALSTFGCLGVAFSSSQLEFMCAIGAWGLGMAAQTPAMDAHAADIAPAHQRGQALSLLRTGADAAMLAGPLSLGLLADLTSPGTAFCWVAALAACSNCYFALPYGQKK